MTILSGKHAIVTGGNRGLGAAIADALAAAQATEPAATPMSQALDGFLGTLVTGILASAAIAVWVRASAPPR
jgi:NAD(P)-dependent dehydrogenase (short-subunit alcohol dehydrogenase family)